MHGIVCRSQRDGNTLHHDSVVALRQTAGQPAPRMTDFGGHLMKLKSLILGSIAASGLSTAGFAADLGVLPSLDVCDELGLSGLTISSDTNCLQISGEVAYTFSWGNYDGKRTIAPTQFGDRNIDVPSANVAPTSNNDWESKIESWLKFVGTASSDFGPASATLKLKDLRQYVATNAVVGLGGD